MRLIDREGREGDLTSWLLAGELLLKQPPELSHPRFASFPMHSTIISFQGFIFSRCRSGGWKTPTGRQIWKFSDGAGALDLEQTESAHITPSW